MKKRLIFFCLLLSFIIIFCYIKTIDNDKVVQREVIYKGNNLLVSIDGVSSTTLPTSGTYYLVNYVCESKNTKLNWDIDNNELIVTNGNKKAGVSCSLEFESNPKLSDMPVGSYVDYTGVGGTVGSTAVACKTNGTATSTSLADTAETEAPNSCLGQNAREDIDTNGNTYGYCYTANYKFHTTGWRIAYIDSNKKPVIISAGSPECSNRTRSTGNATYIATANALALKYCNTDYVDGNCTCTSSTAGQCSSQSTDAWAINDTDFYNITKAISGIGKRLTNNSSGLGDVGGVLEDKVYCYIGHSVEECGYNNDLIDNGGYYWFAAINSTTTTDDVIWAPSYRLVSYSSNDYAYGLRPVISLSSSVVVTGGKGTMEEPYEIANNAASVSTVSTNDESGSVNYILNLLAAPQVTKMCVNVNSSGCSNYVDFEDAYALDSSLFIDGENIVYVYYKNSDGKIVATINESFTYEESE